MQLLQNQTANTGGGAWYRPGRGVYTVGAKGTWDGASVQLQIGKPQRGDTVPQTVEALPDDPALAISEGDAPFTLTLGDEDFIRAEVSTVGAGTDIDLWVG